jgi:hypothetical protein
MANGDDYPRSRLPSWLPLALAVMSLIFTAGQYYFKVQSMDAEIQALRQDLVRKDVFQGQLELLNYRMSGIQVSMQRNEDALLRNETSMQQVLKYIK